MGCDSILTLSFDVLPVFRDTADYAACENELPYSWQGLALSEPGFYSDTLTSIMGCDSILTLNFDVYPVYSIYDTVTVKKLDLPYLFLNDPLTEAGTYTAPLLTVNGCDSIISLTLVIDTTDTILPDIICQDIELTLDENNMPA